MQEERKKRAEVAKDKKAAFGPDIDIGKFAEPAEREVISSLADLPEGLKRAAESVGEYLAKVDPEFAPRVKQRLAPLADNKQWFRNLREMSPDGGGRPCGPPSRSTSCRR